MHRADGRGVRSGRYRTAQHIIQSWGSSNRGMPEITPDSPYGEKEAHPDCAGRHIGMNEIEVVWG